MGEVLETLEGCVEIIDDINEDEFNKKLHVVKVALTTLIKDLDAVYNHSNLSEISSAALISDR